MKGVIDYPPKKVMVLSNQGLDRNNDYWNYFYKRNSAYLPTDFSSCIL